ncbi:fucolectin-6-like [Haliotis rubra]|uniref:fucolectin-6-like n=1 Tax=Haliotis rubra TaxID=36100 RepID=UPI001EE4F9B7|nr:fucolectin-6-like [Haliotis rubra]
MIEKSSLFACAAECASYGICKSFQFESGPRKCHLNVLQYMEGGGEDTGFIHSRIMNWNKTILGPCQNKQCGITERCSVKRNGNVQCEAFLSNIAKDKPASASSIWRGDAFPPGVAVDGDVNPLWTSGSCFAVDIGDFSPWWQVDLQDTYVVVEVRVTNRNKGPERLHDFSIDVYRGDPAGNPHVSPQQCYMYNGAVTEPGRTVALQCTSRVTGRFMRLSGTNTLNRKDLLQFCEVQVFGFKPLQ